MLVLSGVERTLEGTCGVGSAIEGRYANAGFNPPRAADWKWYDPRMQWEEVKFKFDGLTGDPKGFISTAGLALGDAWDVTVECLTEGEED